MINIIKADYYRLVRSVGLYIAFALMLLIIGVSIYLVQPGYVGTTIGSATEDFKSELNEMSKAEIQELSATELRGIMLRSEGYELDRDILSVNMNLYYIFIFIASILISADFGEHTVKNTLSSTTSRNKYFLSKLVFTNVCCAILFFLNTYIVYFSNLLFNNENLASSLATVTEISLLQLPAILALVNITAGLAFMLRKTALYRTVTIPFIMLVQFSFVLIVNILNIDEKYLNYEFQMMLSNLAHDPSGSYLRNCYLVCAVVIAAFITLGYVSFKKAEIK